MEEESAYFACVLQVCVSCLALSLELSVFFIGWKGNDGLEGG